MSMGRGNETYRERRALHLLVGREAVRAHAYQVPAGVNVDSALGQSLREIAGIRSLDREKCSIIGTAALGVDTSIREIRLESRQLLETIQSQAGDSHLQHELLPSSRLIIGENRRSRLVKRVATFGEPWRIRALECKKVFLGEPARV